MVITDKFSKFCMVYPLKKVDTKSTVDCLLDWVKHYGAPTRMISDRGSQFVAAACKDILARLGIKSSLSAPYQPRSHGGVEVLNGFIQKALRHTLAGSQQWQEVLGDLCISWNSTPKRFFSKATGASSATGVGISPHKLFLGTTPRFLWDEHMPDTEDKYTQSEWALHRQQSLTNLTRKVQLDMDRYKMELLYQAHKRWIQKRR